MGEAFVEINDLVPNIIEEELDLNDAVPNNLVPEFPEAEPVIIQALQVPQENWLVEEFPEDMLMDDAELSLEAANAAEEDLQSADAQPLQQQDGNIQLGWVEILDDNVMDPGLASYSVRQQPFHQNAEAIRLWAHNFKDVCASKPTVNIPPEWCNFFTYLLLSPTHFNWASMFLQSKAWDFFSANTGNALFSIPQ